ncbi:MAG: PKD domain-containing protein [Candidatus Omnitrophota bacterium]|nr:PKD domain-containing protein [Candidatus Omnitrophota bacterium]
MHKKTLFLAIIAIVFLSLVLVRQGLCYRVPTEQSNVEYFYVFGADGKKTYGAMRNEPQVVFIKVPVSYKGSVQISVYDPECSGSIDEKSDQWDTVTKFSILGGKGAYTSLAEMDESHIINNKEDINFIDYYEGDLLTAKTFGEDPQYNKAFYSFRPIDASMGEELDGYRYFKIVIEGLAGDDDNLFSLDVSPNDSEAFSFSPAIRLTEARGAKMALYPAIPSDVAKVMEYNYDLDPTGGSIELISPTRFFRINGSKTGMWAKTEINVPSEDSGRTWVYEITKGSQKQGNMALTMLTDKGRSIPIYFTPGKAAPKMVFVEKPKETPAPTGQPLSCNTFTFDGSKSYDPDNTKLTYFWDFGDGTTGIDIRSIHTYKDAGKYLVKLTVKDASDAKCNTATTQQFVKVNQPPCAIADGPDMACLNEEIAFDGSQTTDSPNDKLTYRWDFGDGQVADGIKIKHKYEKGGNYQVILTVTDDSETICDTGADKLNVVVNTPPIADAEKDVFLCKSNPSDPLEVTFNGSGSRDMDGDKLSYAWDFGDGQTADGKVVKHDYEKGGEYIAKLIVTDNTSAKCDKSITTKTVILNRAPMASAGSDLKICAGDNADFDGSKSIDSDGDVLSYSWDFGDGEKGEGKTVSHKYEKGGLYQAKLSVDDGTKTDCSSAYDTILVNVNSAPNAIIASKDAASVGQIVNFDGSDSADLDGDKLDHVWDFGDGTSGNGNLVEHSYAKGGLYKVTLVVDDNRRANCSSSVETHYLKVNTPPVANTGPNQVCCVNDDVEFDGSRSIDADEDKLTYRWDFGDGEMAEGIKVKHAYKNIGKYKVSLTVTDDSGVEGNSSTSSFAATVNAEPVSKIEVI